MDTKTFAELMGSTREALEHAKGKLELRTTSLPEPPKPMSASEIKRVRQKLKASQAVFACYLNVSPKLVQAWEAERRKPQGPALMLLRIAEKSPATLFDAFPKRTATARSRGTRRSGGASRQG